MTTPEPMTREELLELAPLDALGLLDEYESSLFIRSLHHAPSAVQDEVVSLQAAYAADRSLVPGVEPAPELRDRLVRFVTSAIEAEQGTDLEPIGVVGGRRSTDRSSDRSGARSTDRSTERAPQSFRHANGGSQFWRAAALLLAAGNIVFAYFIIDSSQHYTAIARAVIEGDNWARAKEQLGGDFVQDFVSSPRATRIALSSASVADGAPAVAMVYVKESSDTPGRFEIALRTEGLPEESGYTLHAYDANGLALDWDFKTSVHAISGHRIARLSSTVAAVASSLTWEITNASGAVVLRSA